MFWHQIRLEKRPTQLSEKAELAIAMLSSLSQLPITSLASPHLNAVQIGIASALVKAGYFVQSMHAQVGNSSRSTGLQFLIVGDAFLRDGEKNNRIAMDIHGNVGYRELVTFAFQQSKGFVNKPSVCKIQSFNTTLNPEWLHQNPESVRIAEDAEVQASAVLEHLILTSAITQTPPPHSSSRHHRI